MAVFTLDALRDATEAKYGHTHIEDLGVVLVNPLRLKKDKKKALKEHQERVQKEQEEYEKAKEAFEAGKRKTAPAEPDEDEVFEQLAGIIRIVAETDAQAERLLEAVDGDVAFLSTVVSTWTEGTQSGEASSSES